MFFAVLAQFILAIGFSLAESTLGSMEQRSSALIEQETFIEDAIIDIAENYSQYTSYMAVKNMEFPQELMQFYVYMTAETDSDFPTTLFAARFPFTEFYSYITAFPWYSSLLQEAGATTFYLPEHYATVPKTSSRSTPATESSDTSSQPTAGITKYKNTATYKSTTTVTPVTSSSKSSTTEIGTDTSNGASSFYIPSLFFILLASIFY